MALIDDDAVTEVGRILAEVRRTAGAARNGQEEPHRAFIEAQLRLGRNAMAIYQDLVDEHGFAGRYKLGQALRPPNPDP